MNALPIVIRQQAAIKVDTEARSFAGWTELHVAVPPGGGGAPGGGSTLGLHCYGLEVQVVFVNGVPATFDLQQAVREELPESVTAAAYDSQQRQLAAVAESAFYLYERQLQRERQPELSIRLPLLPSPQRGAGGSIGSSSSSSKEELCIRVHFSGGGSSSQVAGLHFWQQYACTDNQVRRASAWLPCVDVPSASTLFQLAITCLADEVAVASGQLQRQSWSDVSRQWRTFHYTLPISCAPCQLGFAVGPFRMLATSHPSPAAAAAANGSRGQQPPGGSSSVEHQQQQQKQLTHFAPQQLPRELGVEAVLASPPSIQPPSPTDAGTAAAGGSGGGGGTGIGIRNGSSGSSGGDVLARSAHFFSLVFTLYEELLGATCPLPAMQQVFLPPEVLLRQGQAVAGLQLLSTAHLIQPRAIEQSITARCAMARCLARHWFGVLLRAASPLDEWLVEGLSGWLEEQYVKRYMGKNELAYRRWRERQAIFLADNGEAPPLAARGLSVPSPWGPLYGTERLGPSHLWSAKATAVIAMIEKQAGEDVFQKHLGNVVAAGIAALQAEQAAAAVAAGTAAVGSAASPAGAGAGVPPAGSPQQQQQQQAAAAAEGGGSGSRLLDTMTFLNDLGRVANFKKEMAPFAARWIYGRGVPHITAAFLHHSRLSTIELALKQTGSESVKHAADIAQRASATEGSNAGIIKAFVREGDLYTEHPVHLGGEAFVLAELKVTPVVEKKLPGRRGRKKKGEGGEEEMEEEAGGAAAAIDPVRWMRLDPAGELLCDIRLMQPERMLAAQLLHSRDVVAQAEAIQRLGELRVGEGVRQAPGLEALRRTLQDKAVFYRVRCDAALVLAGLKDEQGQAAGLPPLLDYYRRQYFHPSSDVPRSVAIADPSEYYVAQAVATAVSLCREPDGSTPVDVLLFLSTCLNDYASAPGAPFSDYGLVAALCAALGNIQFEGFGGSLLVLLEKFLERDAVMVSPGSAIGCACLGAMAALSANVTFDEEEQQRVATVSRRVRQSPGLPLALRHAALAAAVQLVAAQRGPAAALQLALRSIAGGSGGGQQQLLLPAASSAAFMLEETAHLVAAAVAAAAAAAAGQQQEHAEQQRGPAAAEAAAAAAAIPVPMPLLQQLASLLNAGSDCRLRHLAFVLLQLLAVQPPTLYRPPTTEAEDAAAFFTAAAAAAGGQAASMGGHTHRTGGQLQQTAGTAAAAAAAAPRIRLHLGGFGGGARSMAISGVSGPAVSGGGPAMSDARAMSYGAVDQQQQLPAAAQGQQFSPVRQAAAAAAMAGFGGGHDGKEASSRQQQQQQEVAAAEVPVDFMSAFGAPEQQQAAAHMPPADSHPPVSPQKVVAAPPLVSKLRFKMPIHQQQQQQQPPTAPAATVQPESAAAAAGRGRAPSPAPAFAAAQQQQQQQQERAASPAGQQRQQQQQGAPGPAGQQQQQQRPPSRTPSPAPGGVGGGGGGKRRTPPLGPPGGPALAGAPAAKKRKTPSPSPAAAVRQQQQGQPQVKSEPLHAPAAASKPARAAPTAAQFAAQVPAAAPEGPPAAAAAACPPKITKFKLKIKMPTAPQ